MRRWNQWTDATVRLMTGSTFPVFSLTFLFFYVLLLLFLLVVPGSETGLGAFANDFRVWCFSQDPSTGRVDWGYVVAMIISPVMIGATLLLIWWVPLRQALEEPRALVLPATLAALVVAVAAVGLLPGRSEVDPGELPFPAEALRTAHRGPSFSLTNQVGESLDLESLRGKVVLLTAVYASCPTACPVILSQARRAVSEIGSDAGSDLRVVAVTMDPENDSQDALAALATTHQLEAPQFNLMTGEVSEVERALDAMGITRRQDPETGIIDHPNLYLLLDRQGRVAYRLGLGERQERWLVSALRVLLREPSELG